MREPGPQGVVILDGDGAAISPSNPLPVNIGSTENRTATGAITSTQRVSLSVAGCGSGTIQLSGTWTGTVEFKYATDAVPTWYPLEATPIGSGPNVTSATANGSWTVAVAGFSQISAVGNTVASGSATAYLTASTATTTVVLGDSLPAGDAVIGRTKITDGTETNVASVLNSAPTTQHGLVVRVVPPAATAPAGVELSDGSAFYTAAKTGQLPSALGATTAAGSLSVTIATDKATAAAPLGVELSDGSSFYTGAKTGQLPTSLGQTTKSASLSVTPASDSVGTAGSASTTVYTVQGAASMTAVQVGDNSGSLTVDSAQLPSSLGQTTLANSLSVGINSNQIGTAGSSATAVLSVQGIASGTNLPVSQATASALNATVTGGGSAGSAAAGVLTVQGIASMTPIQVGDNSGSLTVDGTVAVSNSFALDATLAKLTISQGASLGSNTQALMGASVTTGAPAYTTGQISPLSLNTNGYLRIDNSSWMGSSAPSVGSKTSSNSIPVVIASDQSTVAVTAAQSTASSLNAQVFGGAANGSATSGNPVLVAGRSGGTTTRTITTDLSGNLQVTGINGAGTQTTANSLAVVAAGAPSYQAITTNTTTTINGNIVVSSIIVASAGVGSTMTLSDGVGGALGVTWTTVAAGQNLIPSPIKFTTSLAVTTTGATPAQLLVVYSTVGS